MSLLLYLDTETTGRYPSTCGATQLSAIIVRDGVEVSTFNIDINPYTYTKDITVSPKALEVTNKTIKELRRNPSVAIGFIQFTAWLNAHRDIGEYYTLIAYRTAFDLEVLEELFKDQVNNSRKVYEYIHYKNLDVLQLVLFMDLYKNISVVNHKLETMCNYYNIPIKAHDSLEDVRATRKLHKKLMGSLGLPKYKINKV